MPPVIFRAHRPGGRDFLLGVPLVPHHGNPTGHAGTELNSRCFIIARTIYTLDIGKCYKPGLSALGDLVVNVYQHITGSKESRTQT